MTSPRNYIARDIGCKLHWDEKTSSTFSVCSDIKTLKEYSIIYQNMFLQNLNQIISSTGCYKPCQYTEYNLVKKDPTQVFENRSDFGVFIHLFPNDDILIKKEVESYSGLSLLADIGGSLGMFLGFSFLTLWDIFGTLMHQLKQTNLLSEKCFIQSYLVQHFNVQDCFS